MATAMGENGGRGLSTNSLLLELPLPRRRQRKDKAEGSKDLSGIVQWAV